MRPHLTPIQFATVSDGKLTDDAEPYDILVERCTDRERKANHARANAIDAGRMSELVNIDKYSIAADVSQILLTDLSGRAFSESGNR